MKQGIWLLFFCSFVITSCSSDNESLYDDNKEKLEEFSYTDDPNIVYANIKAEVAFTDKKES